MFYMENEGSIFWKAIDTWDHRNNFNTDVWQNFPVEDFKLADSKLYSRAPISLQDYRKIKNFPRWYDSILSSKTGNASFHT